MVDVAVGAAIMTDAWLSRFAAAETTLTKVLSLAPNHAGAHLLLGLTKMYTKRVDQGIAECEHALALDRNSANAHSLIGYAKYLLGRGAETEAHINEAFRLSPRDVFAYRWMVWVGLAKAQLGADAEAVAWLRQGLEANRNYSVAHFHLAAGLVRLGELDQARASVQAGLALDPSFTIRRLRAHAWSDNPIFVAGRERVIEGMRMATARRCDATSVQRLRNLPKGSCASLLRLTEIGSTFAAYRSASAFAASTALLRAVWSLGGYQG